MLKFRLSQQIARHFKQLLFGLLIVGFVVYVLEPIRTQLLCNISRDSASIVNVTNRFAIVSLLTTEGYVKNVRVLGYSVRKWIAKDTDMILLVKNETNEKLSIEVKKTLLKSGWTIRCVERIAPPKPGHQLLFVDQFTKIWLWSLDDYERLLYFDADVITVQSMDDLLRRPIEFGAARAYDHEERKFKLTFNCGVMVIQPNVRLFRTFLNLIRRNAIRYDPALAEQNWLNVVFERNFTELPFGDNMLNNLYDSNYELWSKLRPTMRALHTIHHKPFRYDQAENDKREDGRLYNHIIQQMVGDDEKIT